MLNIQDIERQISEAYSRSGAKLGWRFLYSPATVLDQADVAFIGLNPGGTIAEQNILAMDRGSAYVTEPWHAPPGGSKLQVQVRALFDAIGCKPEDVLAGNLVPFRSPSWRDLPNRDAALRFGTRLWAQVLAHRTPKLIICIGADTAHAIVSTLNAKLEDKVPLNWGKVSARRFSHAKGVIVLLPHLSRFPVVRRRESQAGLARVFRGFWRQLETLQRPLRFTRNDWERSDGWNGGWNGEMGDTNVSFIFSENLEAGSGPDLHTHDYDEIQIVRRGKAWYQLGEEELTAEEGDILVIPAGTPHKVRSVGDHSEVISVHLSGRMAANWLEGLPK